MTLNRRSFHRNVVAAVALGLAGAAAHADRLVDEGGLRSGKIFTSTNAAAGNELMVFGGGPGGTLVPLARYSTFGFGTSAGLGSQGAVTLSQDGRWPKATQ